METKKIKTRTELVVYVLVILGIVGVVNYLGAKWFSRVDLTQSKQYSISPATKKVLKHLDDIINIKVYFSKNLPTHMQRTITDVKDVLSEYKAYGGKRLRVTWVDPAESESLKSEARSMGIPEVQLQTVEKDKAQVMNGYLGIAVLFADRKEVLPVVQKLENLEYDLTLAIMKVSRSTTPTVGILKLDTLPEIPPQYMRQMPQEQMQDRTEVKFQPVFDKLKETYTVNTVDVAKGTPVDSTLKALIVPGSTPLSERALFEIDQYFMKGGKLIVLADAMKIDMNQYYGPMAANVESKLFDMLEIYGAKVEQKMVIDASCGQVQIPQKIGPFQGYVAVPYPYFVRIGTDGFNGDNPAVSPLSEIVMPWPNPITLMVDQAPADKDAKKGSKAAQSGVKATILAHSSKKSWTAAGSIDLNPQQQWKAPPDDKLSSSTLAVHLAGSFKSYFAGKTVPPVGGAATGDSLSQIKPNAADEGRKIIETNPKGHLVVIGNSGFVSGQNAAPQNVMMLVNLVDWLTQDDNLISIRTRSVKDRTIEADLLKKGSATPNIVRFVNIITMPLLVIIAGLLIFFRRRDQIKAVPSTSPAVATGNKTEEKHS